MYLKHFKYVESMGLKTRIMYTCIIEKKPINALYWCYTMLQDSDTFKKQWSQKAHDVRVSGYLAW